jgi:hypothetical protein
MGVSFCWVGVEAKTADEVYARLGVFETGASGDCYDFPISGLMLPSSWFLLAAKGCDHAILSARVLSEISAKGSAIACSIEEHVMYQSAAMWCDGREIWGVKHRGGDYGIMDLVVNGSPPEPFEELRTRYMSEQMAEGGAEADADLIAEIPLDLARSITGFKHDEVNPAIDGYFRELRGHATGLLAEAARRRWKFW